MTSRNFRSMNHYFRRFSPYNCFFILLLTLVTCRVQRTEIAPTLKPKIEPIVRVRMPSGTYTMEHDGRTREYILHLPRGRENESRLPLVVALHGGPGYAKNMEEFTGLSQKADKEGFIVVYPNGTSHTDPVFLNWNSGGCCGYAWENKVDDMGFLRRLVEAIDAEYHIDRSRVYATGFSKGGMMSHRLACEASDLFSGIADVGGALNLDTCKPKYPVDMLIIHGREDINVKYGGPMPARLLPLDDHDDRPVSYAVHVWQHLNGCGPARPRSRRNVEWTYFNCRRASLRLISIAQEAHSWPGGNVGLIGSDNPTQEVSATDAMWQFWSESYKLRKGHRQPLRRKRQTR
jgi:polyhydroxybutyrate depolymerase